MKLKHAIIQSLLLPFASRASCVAPSCIKCWKTLTLNIDFVQAVAACFFLWGYRARYGVGGLLVLGPGLYGAYIYQL